MLSLTVILDFEALINIIFPQKQNFCETASSSKDVETGDNDGYIFCSR